jgi:hypothetical protein
MLKGVMERKIRLLEERLGNLERARHVKVSLDYLDGYFCRQEVPPCVEDDSDGLTAKGIVAILANQLLAIHSKLIRVRTELSQDPEALGDHQRPNDYIVNGLLASAITGLQSVQDGIASFCKREVPDTTVNGLCNYCRQYP